jgi:hypothetical protein
VAGGSIGAAQTGEKSGEELGSGVGVKGLMLGKRKPGYDPNFCHNYIFPDVNFFWAIFSPSSGNCSIAFSSCLALEASRSRYFATNSS